jgi:hypothetical protein
MKMHTGYIQVLCGGHPDAIMNYVFLHRLIASCKIGRSILPDEDVHHIDGDKLNNSYDNLEVLKRSEHRRHHALKTWRGN